mgnify:CR=1 FL=1
MCSSDLFKHRGESDPETLELLDKARRFLSGCWNALGRGFLDRIRTLRFLNLKFAHGYSTSFIFGSAGTGNDGSGISGTNRALSSAFFLLESYIEVAIKTKITTSAVNPPIAI